MTDHASSHSQTTADSHQPDADGIRVLLVDDDERWGKVTAKHLSATNDDLDVTFRASAAAGLDVIESSLIDCIVSDYQMPETSGLEFLATVREQYPDLPFLLLTGRGDESVASTAIEKGVTGYISKEATRSETPVLPSRIRSVVETFRAKRRLAIAQERVEHLHAVTLDLEGATTREAVYERLTTAGASTLALGTCHVLVEDDGDFQQVAFETTAASGDAPSALIDAIAEDCFVAESPMIRDALTHNETTYSVLCVPIGSVGVLLAMDQTRKSYDQHDLNACDILASHAGAALDRIQSQERLRVERDSKAAMRDILTAATERGTVEQSTCTHLVETGDFALAWVGEFTPSDGLSIRASAGETDYLDAVSVSPDASGTGTAVDDEPAIQTLVAESETAVRVGTDPDTDWKRATRDYGIEYVVAQPLTTNDVLHGVLAVYAPREIDDHRRELLEEYADSLAVGIDDAKRDQVLHGETVTHLELQVPAAGSPIATLSEALSERGEPDAITVQSVVPSDDNVRYFVTVSGATVDQLQEITHHRDEERIQSVEQLGEEDGQFTIDTWAPTVESIILDSGGMIVESTASGGETRIEAEVSGRGDASGVVDSVHDHAPGATVTTVQDVESTVGEADQPFAAELTDKQRQALKAAYFSGYFERPRVLGADDVAETLGISRQAFLQHLRVAENKVFTELFDDE
jgi:predicted DNA binding protein/DNA-binding NarL/FixJ family response regulator